MRRRLAKGVVLASGALFVALAGGCRSAARETPQFDAGGAQADTSGLWPPPCATAAECPAPLQYCIAGLCRSCLTDVECAVPWPRCGSDNMCVACLADADCPASRPQCVDYACVECRWDADCPPERPVCWEHGSCDRCGTADDCPAERPHCSSVTGIRDCVECVFDQECPDARSYCIDGFCSACCECGCVEDALPQFPRSSLACEAACGHLAGVCTATMAGCTLCANLPTSQDLAGCISQCESPALPYSSWRSAMWGCLAANDACDTYTECYRSSCTVTATRGPGCMPGPCDPPLSPGDNHGPGGFGDSCTVPGDCGNAMSCFDGVCACQGAFVGCGTRCVDLGSDAEDCGVCGNPCRPGQICCSGACTTL